MSGYARRTPYPFDCKLAGTGLMLLDGVVGSKKAATLEQVAPTDYTYGANSPLRDRPQPYDDLSLGFGLKVQQGFRDRKYRYALNANLSVGGVWLKGPELGARTPSTTDATNGIAPTFGFVIGTDLYILAGRYCLKRTSDTAETTSRDFGSTKYAISATTFYSNALASTYAFVAMAGTEKAYSFDGTTWTQYSNFTAIDWAVVGNDLYRAHSTNLVSKCDIDANPTVEANWTAVNQFVIGDKSSAITRLAVTATGQLLIFKTDGIYSLDVTGEDIQYYPFLKFAPSSENGKYWGGFGNDVHTTYGNSHVRLDPNLKLTPIGPERATDNDSEVRGRVTAFHGHDVFHAYAGLYNADTGHSYLMQFGAYLPADPEAGRLEAERIDAWHGSLTPKFTSKKITALFKSTVGAAAGHARLYIGFSDGTYQWFTLPCVPNPAACTAYTFSTADGQVYLPLWHGTFQNDRKALRTLTIGSLNASATNYAEFAYKTDLNAAAYTTFNVDFNTARHSDAFEANTSAVLADFRVTLKSSSTASCPQLTSVTPSFQARPERVMVRDLSIVTEEGLIRRDGSPLRLSKGDIKTLVETAVDALSVALVLPDETSEQVSLIDYGLAQEIDHRGTWRGVQKVTAIQFATSTNFGAIGRLAAYSVGDLLPFTVLEIGSL